MGRDLGETEEERVGEKGGVGEAGLLKFKVEILSTEKKKKIFFGSNNLVAIYHFVDERGICLVPIGYPSHRVSSGQ